jgi:transcriptional regulator with XRE-family HTH domain
VKTLFDILPKNLRDTRLGNGMSQEELAEQVEISTRYLQDIEAGRHTNLTLILLARLAQKLNVEAWKLICPGAVRPAAITRRPKKPTGRR